MYYAHFVMKMVVLLLNSKKIIQGVLNITRKTICLSLRMEQNYVTQTLVSSVILEKPDFLKSLGKISLYGLMVAKFGKQRIPAALTKFQMTDPIRSPAILQ